MTPEGKIKKLVKEYLDEIGAYHFWPVQMGYGAKTLDCLACIDGLFIGIETKAAGKRLTKLQEICAKKIFDADGECFMIYDEESLEGMKHTIAALRERHQALIYS